jgi:hypothetical protein
MSRRGGGKEVQMSRSSTLDLVRTHPCRAKTGSCACRSSQLNRHISKESKPAPARLFTGRYLSHCGPSEMTEPCDFTSCRVGSEMTEPCDFTSCRVGSEMTEPCDFVGQLAVWALVLVYPLDGLHLCLSPGAGLHRGTRAQGRDTSSQGELVCNLGLDYIDLVPLRIFSPRPYMKKIVGGLLLMRHPILIRGC